MSSDCQVSRAQYPLHPRYSNASQPEVHVARGVREKTQGVKHIFINLRFRLRFAMKMPSKAFTLGTSFLFFLLEGTRAEKGMETATVNSKIFRQRMVL